MRDAAPMRGAWMEFIPVSGLRDPLRAARGVVVVDSLAAWAVAPWVLLHRIPGRRRRAPLAAIVHQPPGGIGHGRLRTAVQRALDRALYRRCDVVISASTALRHELVAEHGLPPERVRVAEPGSDAGIEASGGSTAFDASAGDELRRGRRIALLTVANWTPNKGLVELLEAVAALPSDAATLHLVGRDDVDPAYAARVRARAQEPGLAPRVVVHGAVAPSAVGRLYAAADVFVMTSYVEAYGTVFAEALAAGLPVVGWRSGNLPNLVDDGREGCLVEPGDLAGLGRALLRLSIDAAWRDELSAAARRRGATLPTWNDTADSFFAALPLAPAGAGRAAQRASSSSRRS